ncbi:MAG: HNH endonuclease, partial [Bacteroidales bacterium]|nr:HNH endonuclease [Candidatus Colicola faecequi]
MSQPKYKIYPSLLDAFQRVKEAKTEFESVFNEDGEGGYKRTYEEVVADLEQQLLDSINRVPHAPIEAADKGTAFNEIVDCLVHNRESSNPALSLSSMQTEGGSRYVRAEINCFKFDFDFSLCNAAADYFAGSTSQYLVKAPLATPYGEVELYGYLDELRANIVYDIKTTAKYEFGKYANHWQHHVYPY